MGEGADVRGKEEDRAVLSQFPLLIFFHCIAPSSQRLNSPCPLLMSPGVCRIPRSQKISSRRKIVKERRNER